MTEFDKTRERRWIVLGEDGRFVTLGRQSDPTEAEIGHAEASLERQRLSGWLAVMEGNPYVGPLPHLMCVKPLSGPSRPFSEAAAACVAAIEAQRAGMR